MRAMKGHILEPPYEGDEPLECSYVYNPSDYEGYAYMYPRKQTIVFDGSYLEGDIVDGEWTGESPNNPVTVDGEAVPERLVAVSSEITNDYVEFDREAISVKHGYRPYREDGLRVEAEEGLIHNYGHGEQACRSRGCQQSKLSSISTACRKRNWSVSPPA